MMLKPKMMTVEATVIEYECPGELLGLGFKAATATFQSKGEDNFAFVTASEEPKLAAAQQNRSSSVPMLLAYAGVFDGHDGDSASNYCASGLLSHILAETAESIETHFKKRSLGASTRSELSAGGGPTGKHAVEKVPAIDGTVVFCPLDAGFVNAYHRAESRFASDSAPPTFEEVMEGAKRTRVEKNFLQRMCCLPQPPRRGGTTALTLNVYAEKKFNEKGKETSMPLHYVVVANTGDSRCITDDGSGTSQFRQVTVDHRPGSPSEARRLCTYLQQGYATVERELEHGVLRVYPGGLAVSRTIGDVGLAKAVICTPDVFHVPLTRGRTHRFVMASDGLWDVFSNEKVGALAAQRQKKPAGVEMPQSQMQSPENGDSGTSDNEHVGGTRTHVGPKEAAKKVLEQCLKHGGYQDDVTIMIVDVTCGN